MGNVPASRPKRGCKPFMSAEFSTSEEYSYPRVLCKSGSVFGRLEVLLNQQEVTGERQRRVGSACFSENDLAG